MRPYRRFRVSWEGGVVGVASCALGYVVWHRPVVDWLAGMGWGRGRQWQWGQGRDGGWRGVSNDRLQRWLSFSWDTLLFWEGLGGCGSSDDDVHHLPFLRYSSRVCTHRGRRWTTCRGPRKDGFVTPVQAPRRAGWYPPCGRGRVLSTHPCGHQLPAAAASRQVARPPCRSPLNPRGPTQTPHGEIVF